MIKISDVDVKELAVFSIAVLEFITEKNKNINQLLVRDQNEYLSRVLLIDIAKEIFHFFRNKIENFSRTKPTTSLSFNAHEAIVLLQCCDFSLAFGDNTSDEFHNHTLRTAKELIFNKMINL